MSRLSPDERPEEGPMSYLQATWEDVDEGDYIKDEDGKWWRVYVFESGGHKVLETYVWLEDKEGLEARIELPPALTPVTMFRSRR
jgi:hypothetical protein